MKVWGILKLVGILGLCLAVVFGEEETTVSTNVTLAEEGRVDTGEVITADGVLTSLSAPNDLNSKLERKNTEGLKDVKKGGGVLGSYLAGLGSESLANNADKIKPPPQSITRRPAQRPPSLNAGNVWDKNQNFGNGNGNFAGGQGQTGGGSGGYVIRRRRRTTTQPPFVPPRPQPSYFQPEPDYYDLPTQRPFRPQAAKFPPSQGGGSYGPSSGSFKPQGPQGGGAHRFTPQGPQFTTQGGGGYKPPQGILANIPPPHISKGDGGYRPDALPPQKPQQPPPLRTPIRPVQQTTIPPFKTEEHKLAYHYLQLLEQKEKDEQRKQPAAQPSLPPPPPPRTRAPVPILIEIATTPDYYDYDPDYPDIVRSTTTTTVAPTRKRRRRTTTLTPTQVSFQQQQQTFYQPPQIPQQQHPYNPYIPPPQPQTPVQQPAYYPPPQQVQSHHPAYAPPPQATPQPPAYAPPPQVPPQQPAYVPPPQVPPQQPIYAPHQPVQSQPSYAPPAQSLPQRPAHVPPQPQQPANSPSAHPPQSHYAQPLTPAEFQQLQQLQQQLQKQQQPAYVPPSQPLQHQPIYAPAPIPAPQQPYYPPQQQPAYPPAIQQPIHSFTPQAGGYPVTAKPLEPVDATTKPAIDDYDYSDTPSDNINSTTTTTTSRSLLAATTPNPKSPQYQQFLHLQRLQRIKLLLELQRIRQMNATAGNVTTTEDPYVYVPRLVINPLIPPTKLTTTTDNPNDPVQGLANLFGSLAVGNLAGVVDGTLKFAGTGIFHNLNEYIACQMGRCGDEETTETEADTSSSPLGGIFGGGKGQGGKTDKYTYIPHPPQHPYPGRKPGVVHD